MSHIHPHYIMELKKQLIYEMNHQKRNGIYGFIQRAMAYNSNRIEGSTLNEHQTASMFETGTVDSEENMLLRTKDIEEMTGHFRMMNQTLQAMDSPLDIKTIKQMHYNLKIGVFEDMANGYPCGDFKSRENRVSTITTALPQDVPERMDKLMAKYSRIEKPTVEDLAKFHAEYENIHPFQDGNGRTGRMILFRESLKHGMVPIIIRSNNKDRYIRCLYLAQTKGNARNLTEYLQEEQEAFYEETKNMVLPHDMLDKIEQKNGFETSETTKEEYPQKRPGRLKDVTEYVKKSRRI